MSQTDHPPIPADLSDMHFAELSNGGHARKSPLTLKNIAPIILEWLRWDPDTAKPIRARKIAESLCRDYDPQVETAILKADPRARLSFDSKVASLQAWICGAFDKVTALLLSQEATREIMIETLNQQKGRSFRLDFMDELPFTQSLMRKADGSLRSTSDLTKLMTTGTNARAVLLTVSKTGDIEAYVALKRLRSIKLYMATEYIVATARLAKQEIPERFMQFMLTGKSSGIDPGAIYQVQQKMDIGEWLGACIGAVRTGAWGTARNIYDADLARKGGHEIICEMFKRELKALPGDDVFVKKMIHDGADWYIGFQQYLVGSYTYLSLKDRVPDPLAEVTELIERGNRVALASVVGNILQALPEELVMAYVTNTRLANKVYKLAKLPYLREHVSERVLTESLEQDIGL